MVNGVLMVELFLPEANSLKEKRRRIKSLVDRLRQRFNVAVAEVDGQGTWQRATLAIAAVAAERVFIDRVFQEVVNFTDSYRDMMLNDYRVEFYGVYLGGQSNIGMEKVEGRR